MLTADAILLLQDKAVQASKPNLLMDNGPEEVLYEIKGQLVPVQKNPPSRAHSVNDVESFVGCVERYGSNGVVFHDSSSLELVCDDESRFDRVTMKLPHSERFKLVTGLSETAFDQRQFVKLLKVLLVGSIDETLLAKVRNLKVSQSGSNSREISPGREQGTQEFFSELSNAQEFLDYYDILVPVYEVSDFQTSESMRFSFDYDLSAMTFRLTEVTGEIVAALQRQQDALHTRLVDSVPDGVSVFYGQA